MNIRTMPWYYFHSWYEIHTYLSRYFLLKFGTMNNSSTFCFILELSIYRSCSILARTVHSMSTISWFYSVLLFSTIFFFCFLDALDPVMKINNVWGDVTDISATKNPLVLLVRPAVSRTVTKDWEHLEPSKILQKSVQPSWTLSLDTARNQWCRFSRFIA